MLAGTNQRRVKRCQQYAVRMECAGSGALGIGRALAPVDFAPDEDPARCWDTPTDSACRLCRLRPGFALAWGMCLHLGHVSRHWSAEAEASRAELGCARSPGAGRVVRGEVARCATRRRLGGRMESPELENW